ncbi:dNMP kinase [Streptomyces phage Shady]|uniref:DNMP kinase n=1 Tax=Streptomyces phage Shady TaxID=2767585 RepID=A0A873WHF7_9CAUD|nr:dNMP kinase [Streptomyces phage Shady]
MHDVALMGKARSGKDTAAAFLVDVHGYKRLAFADPLKHMADEVDPLIPTSVGVHVRLKSLVRDVGWEYAKDNYPEVRRVLQHIGQTIRDRDPDYWVRLLMAQVEGAREFGYPVVVSDVRYPNEAEALRAAGFKLVRIYRPGNEDAGTHESETALDNYVGDAVIRNDMTPAFLGYRVTRYLMH